MKKTTTFLALGATTAVLTACGSGTDTAAAPVAPVVAPQTSTSAAPARSGMAPVPDPGAEVDADDQSGDGTAVVVRDARIAVGPGWLASAPMTTTAAAGCSDPPRSSPGRSFRSPSP